MVYLTRFTKNVPKLANFFSKFLKLVLKDGKFPFNREVLKRYAFPKLAIFLRKNSNFCPIAFLNVEGNLSFNLVSKYLETHLIHYNKFINSSTQKGSMEKIPGRWEHLSMVWEALKKARV